MNAQEYLSEMKDKLLAEGNWQTVILEKPWLKSIPEEAGVYAFKDGNDEIVYVGETGNLRKRMRDLFDSRNHTIRRTIGERFYGDRDGFVMASTSVIFPDHIEELVNSHICGKLKVSILPLELGRKELEEFIVSKITKNARLNKRGKRK